MGYGTQLGSDDLKGGFTPRLTRPYLGPAKLISGGFTKVGKDQDKEVIHFTFQLLGDDVKGLEHQQVIFEPTDNGVGDLDEKIDKMRKRVAYMLAYFAGEEMTINAVNAAKSFQNLALNVGKALERTAGQWKDKVVHIKVPGQVYNSKAQLGMPNYVGGYIADEASSASLAWSKKEIEANAAYNAALDTPSSTPAEAGEGSPVSEANSF